MIPQELPRVADDKGYQDEARLYAVNTMRKIAPMYDLTNWMQKSIERAYLDGAQSSIRIGYHLAEKEYIKVINYYKKQLKELKGGEE